MIKAQIVLVVLTLLFSTSIFASSQLCRHSPNTFRCVKFIKNYDGDTITFSLPRVHAFFGKQTVIRVRGVDTPELRTQNLCEKEMGYKGKELIYKTLANAHRIDLINCTRGKYYRIVADVIVDGVSLKDILIENKLAVEYWGGTKQNIDWCSF